MRPVAIIMPTIGTFDAGKVLGEAQATAGIECYPIIVEDMVRTGFSKTVNRGLAQVPDGHDVLFLNDDVSGWYEGWLAQLSETLYSRDDFGLVGPSGDCSTDPMRRWRIGDHGLVSVTHYPFWCALLRREVFDQVGMLDETFIHYASDYDYCDRIRAAGWLIVWMKEAMLQHVCGGSGKLQGWSGHDLSLYMLRRKQRGETGRWLGPSVSLS